MITFQKILPEDIINLSPLALYYLQQASDRTPASTGRFDVTLDIAKKGYGNIYLIFNDNELTGCCYIMVYPSKVGKIVAPILVGGSHMESWNADFYEFVQDFSRKLDAHKIRWIGRKGWKKAYPKSKVIGYVYEHDVDQWGGV